MEPQKGPTETIELENGDKIAINTLSGSVVRIGKGGDTFLMNDFIRLTDEFEHGLAG